MKNEYLGMTELPVEKRAASVPRPLLFPVSRPRSRKTPPRPTRLNRWDTRLFQAGLHGHLYEKLGAHPMTVHGMAGTYFAVWAPNAQRVSIVGDFNRWDREASRMRPCGSSGVWEGFVPGAQTGDRYKYYMAGQNSSGHDKSDPLARSSQEPPETASVVWDLEYVWGDEHWLQERAQKRWRDAPVSIYEVHLGSWMRVPEERNRWLTYRESAVRLAEYAQRMGFTHVELLPITEHPFYGSWGYQPTGFFAPTRRYGTPQDFMYLVDLLHQRGIAVILDWVPYHFPKDHHALSMFDGTDLYNHPDPRRGYHPVWKSAVFDYGRPEVRSFLLSSAQFWLSQYHVDGLRVDAVSYMMYLDYYRKGGEWLPNRSGGQENVDALRFLRELNEDIHRHNPGALTIAEEATAWPKISRPIREGGLGFDFKWDMGWMHDTLQYFAKPFHQRRHLQNKLTFRMMYAFAENFLLALSHDEVVHLKRSLLNKMAGDTWQKFAGLRLLYAYMYGLPGKKLLFMGDEFAQQREWNHEQSLDWHLLQQPLHAGMQRCVEDLNRLYRSYPALHEVEAEPSGFEWVACDDTANCVMTFLRRGRSTDSMALVVCNFLPVCRTNYRVGVPRSGFWTEVFNSDAREYGGSGAGNCGGVHSDPVSWNWRPDSVNLTVPPLAALFFVHEAPYA
jgi:1,4-alpha-glucan branching enzyme